MYSSLVYILLNSCSYRTPLTILRLNLNLHVGCPMPILSGIFFFWIALFLTNILLCLNCCVYYYYNERYCCWNRMLLIACLLDWLIVWLLDWLKGWKNRIKVYYYAIRRIFWISNRADQRAWKWLDATSRKRWTHEPTSA